MKIDILCNDGSPMGVIWEDIYGRGVGGAELSMLTLAEYLSRAGNEVTIYNNPIVRGSAHDISYMPLGVFRPDDKERDVLIVFRSPSELGRKAIAKRKIWWSTDQHTIGNFASFIHHVDFCVTISPFHTQFHKQKYFMPDDKIGHIDLGVRDDYNNEVEKLPNNLIFCSVPDRGLRRLYQMWPDLRKAIPDLTLTITSDYRLWGSSNPNNQHHRLEWMGVEGVEFLGKVSREKMVYYQQRAQILAYPCVYEELFCISAAECQVAGAYPITSTFGALPTTNKFGSLLGGDPRGRIFYEGFIAEVVKLLVNEPNLLKEKQELMMKEAKTHFSWDIITKRWLHLFETGALDG